MVKRTRASVSALLAGAALGALSIVVAAGVASAEVAPAPVLSIVDGGDGYINGTEITAVKVTGTYVPSSTPALDRVRIRVNQSATCDPNATPSTNWVFVTPTGASFEYTFDLSDAAQNPDFAEGDAFCAIARAYYGTDLGLLGTSTNRPVKDTVVLAGTVRISDPDGRGYLNADELAVDPTGLAGVWTANPSSDASAAQTWFAKGSDASIPDPSCGPEPATISGSPSSVSSGGLDPDQPLAQACGTAMTEGGEITFNARWTDVAGNISPVATTSLGEGTSVLKDTIAPATPVVDILGKAISGRNVINLSNHTATNVRVMWTDGDIDYIDTEVKDTDAGTAHLTQRQEPIDDAAGLPLTTSVTYDFSSLTDCGPQNFENPNPNPTNCLTATAVLTDLAGNDSLPDTDVAMKDTAAPTAPVIRFTPDTLNDINDSLTDLEVEGEAYATAWTRITDEDPGSPDITNIAPLPSQPGFTLPNITLQYGSFYPGPLHGFNGWNVDVTPLGDGRIDASVYLVDPWENVGPASATFATKNFTVGSLTLTSPVSGSLQPRNVQFSGFVTDGVANCVGCTVKVFQRNNPNYNHPDNIAMATITTDADGKFQTNYKYLKSGTMKAFFRLTNVPSGQMGTFGYLLNRPSVVTTFDVDAVDPTIAITTANESIYTPGEPVIVRGTAGDDFSGVLGVEIQVYPLLNPSISPNPANPQIRPNQPVYASERAASCPTCGSALSKNVAWSFDLSALPSGRYTVEAYSVDRVGARSLARPQVSVIVIR